LPLVATFCYADAIDALILIFHCWYWPIGFHWLPLFAIAAISFLFRAAFFFLFAASIEAFFRRRCMRCRYLPACRYFSLYDYAIRQLPLLIISQLPLPPGAFLLLPARYFHYDAVYFRHCLFSSSCHMLFADIDAAFWCFAIAFAFVDIAFSLYWLLFDIFLPCRRYFAMSVSLPLYWFLRYDADASILFSPFLLWYFRHWYARLTRFHAAAFSDIVIAVMLPFAWCPPPLFCDAADAASASLSLMSLFRCFSPALFHIADDAAADCRFHTYDAIISFRRHDTLLLHYFLLMFRLFDAVSVFMMSWSLRVFARSSPTIFFADRRPPTCR